MRVSLQKRIPPKPSHRLDRNHHSNDTSFTRIPFIRGSYLRRDNHVVASNATSRRRTSPIDHQPTRRSTRALRLRTKKERYCFIRRARPRPRRCASRFLPTSRSAMVLTIRSATQPAIPCVRRSDNHLNNFASRIRHVFCRGRRHDHHAVVG